MSNVHFSSKTDDWYTPWEIVNRYGIFDLDPCATKHNSKAHRYFTKDDNGLAQDWFGRVFMNPPYGREISKWMEKAYTEVKKGNAKEVVCLIPSRTDTRWWHEYCMKGEIDFLKGRIKFGDSNQSAPFPSAIVIFSEALHDNKSANR